MMRPLSIPGLALCVLLGGCPSWHQAAPLPPELSEAGIRARLLIPTQDIPDGEPIVKAAIQPEPETAPEPSVFTLADAVAYGQRHSPRLRAAHAALDASSGHEQAAFAAFLPELGIFSQTGASTHPEGPGIPSLSGFLLASTPGPHTYSQGIVQFQWTVYDFGRRTGRYNQAAARQRITEYRLTRAEQTVQFDVAVGYLNILLAQASLRVQEEAVRQAEATLKDARARLAGGVADPDDVLRAEVQLSESRDGVVRAQEAKVFAVAQLDNTMGRNAALPLEVMELAPPLPNLTPSLAKSLENAATLRPEISFAREAVVAAQEGVAAAKAAFRPNIYVRGATGQVLGTTNVVPGWQNGIGLHFELPLYTGGRLSGDLHAAEAEVAAALADAQTILDGVSLEVTQAYQGELAAGQRLELSRTAVIEAQENLRLVRVKYRNGNATPTDIVDAETTMTRSQQRLKTALYTHLAALARLDYAVGQAQGTLLRHAQAPGTVLKRLPATRPRPRPRSR